MGTRRSTVDGFAHWGGHVLTMYFSFCSPLRQLDRPIRSRRMCSYLLNNEALNNEKKYYYYTCLLFCVVCRDCPKKRLIGP